jgi:hypothetical protein
VFKKIICDSMSILQGLLKDAKRFIQKVNVSLELISLPLRDEIRQFSRTM